VPTRRGLFMGNRSITYGLIVIFFSILIIEAYNKSARERLTGPIDDIFRRHPDKLLIVYPTASKTDSSLRDYAHKVAGLLNKKLHADILVYPDVEVDEDLLRNYSFILYGPIDENLVSRELKDYFPFHFGEGEVTLDGRRYDQENWRLIFIVPNPYNKRHYILVYTGRTANDLVGINLSGHPNFTHHDSTDYVLAVGSQIVEQGHFDKHNRSGWVLAH